MVVVDDLCIVAPSGESFDLNNDFALPKGAKFYSDLNAPEGAPTRAEREAKKQREQPTIEARPRQPAVQRNAAAREESEEDDSQGPPLLNEGHYPQGDYYRAQYQEYDYPAPAAEQYRAPAADYRPAANYRAPMRYAPTYGQSYGYQGTAPSMSAASLGHLPPQHRDSITRQLGGMSIAGGNAGYGQGYAPRPSYGYESYAPAQSYGYESYAPAPVHSYASSYGYGEPVYNYGAPSYGRAYPGRY